jgi:hypothetical protein
MAVNTDPAWYQAWQQFDDELVVKPVLTANPTQENITFNCGDTEMLVVAKDGFYVRGVKATQDDKEAENVYNCFKEWLSWNVLNNGN